MNTPVDRNAVLRLAVQADRQGRKDTATNLFAVAEMMNRDHPGPKLINDIDRCNLAHLAMKGADLANKLGLTMEVA